jgi:hypothetical protein
MNIFYKDGDQLIMSYFDNFDNEFLNEYKINLTSGKKFVNVLFYL